MVKVIEQRKVRGGKGEQERQDVAQEVIDRIIAGYRPQRVILHGSFARGDYHEGSDVDLVIVKDTDARFVDRIEQMLVFSDSK